MDSSRPRSRATQEEERAGYGGATAQARMIEIKHFLQRERAGEALRRTGGETHRGSGGNTGTRLLTHPGSSREKRREKGGEEGEIILLDLMD